MSSVLCAQADPMNGKLQQEHWLNDVKSYQMVEVWGREISYWSLSENSRVSSMNEVWRYNIRTILPLARQGTVHLYSWLRVNYEQKNQIFESSQSKTSHEKSEGKLQTIANNTCCKVDVVDIYHGLFIVYWLTATVVHHSFEFSWLLDSPDQKLFTVWVTFLILLRVDTML